MQINPAKRTFFSAKKLFRTEKTDEKYKKTEAGGTARSSIQ